MYRLQIGQPTTLTAGMSEGVYFTIDASGPMMIFNLSNPRPDEVKSFQAGQPAEFRLSRVAGILFILAKVGSVAWAEAPYAAQLEPNVYLDSVPEGQGYGLQLILVDRATSIVRGLRLVGLPTKFSRALLSEIMDDVGKPTTQLEHFSAVNKVFATYNTKDLLKFSSAHCKIEGEG